MVSAAAHFFGRAFALCLGFGSAPLPPAVGVLDLKWEWQIPTQNREFHFGPLHTHVYYIYICVCVCVYPSICAGRHVFVYLPTYVFNQFPTYRPIYLSSYLLPTPLDIYLLS